MFPRYSLRIQLARTEWPVAFACGECVRERASCTSERALFFANFLPSVSAGVWPMMMHASQCNGAMVHLQPTALSPQAAATQLTTTLGIKGNGAKQKQKQKNKADKSLIAALRDKFHH